MGQTTPTITSSKVNEIISARKNSMIWCEGPDCQAKKPINTNGNPVYIRPHDGISFNNGLSIFSSESGRLTQTADGVSFKDALSWKDGNVEIKGSTKLGSETGIRVHILEGVTGAKEMILPVDLSDSYKLEDILSISGIVKEGDVNYPMGLTKDANYQWRAWINSESTEDGMKKNKLYIQTSGDNVSEKPYRIMLITK